MTNKKKKQFLKLPKLDGGNNSFKKFVEENLRYPEDALKHNIEGIVYLSYDVDDFGNVLNTKIEKGIGFGCDEEALRLIKMQKFSKVKNKGLRVKISQKAKIIFSLKNIQNNTTTINYTIVNSPDTATTTAETIKYSYSVNIEKT